MSETSGWHLLSLDIFRLTSEDVRAKKGKKHIKPITPNLLSTLYVVQNMNCNFTKSPRGCLSGHESTKQYYVKYHGVNFSCLFSYTILVFDILWWGLRYSRPGRWQEGNSISCPDVVFCVCIFTMQKIYTHLGHILKFLIFERKSVWCIVRLFR